VGYRCNNRYIHYVVEPVRQKIKEIVAFVVEKQLKVIIQTNGAGITVAS
jgi:hypothetical protein